MQKIYQYILNGKGIGLLFLLLLSLIMAIYFTIVIRNGGKSFIPIAQDTADQILPIKIENGIVVTPSETIKNIPIKFNKEGTISYPLVIDTTQDTMDTTTLKPGIYLSKTSLYTVKNGEIRVIKLQDNLEIQQGDYTKFFQSVLNWFSLLVGLFGALILFAVYLLLGVFYAWCSYAVSAVFSKKYDFSQRMRLGILSMLTVYLVFLPLNMIITTSWFLFFICVILLQGIVIYQLPKQNN